MVNNNLLQHIIGGLRFSCASCMSQAERKRDRETGRVYKETGREKLKKGVRIVKM